ncbi:MAG TPA: sigma-70 family RNA polymerase sigma factor, partial [Candidatus Sumerlaeia bacterium]|nr:sigma-70 family RNA polymerase sigma factor [Candidatus Sumerlaeia bacterium]
MFDDDTQLMIRFSTGEENAFDQLFQRNSRRAYDIAIRFLANPDDAEDIVQEAFLRIYSSKKSWKPKASFNTWLY